MTFIAYIKTHFLSFLTAVLAGIAVSFLAFFSYDEIKEYNRTVPVSEAYDLTFSADALKIPEGEKQMFTPELTEKSADAKRRSAKEFAQYVFLYHIKDESIATVNDMGEITAHKRGETEITVTFGPLFLTEKLYVYMPATSVRFTEKVLLLTVGETVKLPFEILPLEAAEQNEIYQFTPTEPGVLRVTKDGTATALTSGFCRVWLTEGDLKTSIPVFVYEEVEAISFTQESYRVVRGESEKLSLVTTPEKIRLKDVTYTSSDNEIATVSENGTVQGVKGGDAVITASYGELTAQTTVHVVSPIEGVKLYYQDLRLPIGEEKELAFYFEPFDANEPCEAEWESTNLSVATVSEEGVVKAVGPGSCEIKIKAKEYEASSKLTVEVPVRGVSISQGAITLNKGNSHQLSAAVVPGNTTENPFITWSSDNLKVATVNAAGLVQAVGPGVCNITANHDLFGASCQVSVQSPMSGISVSPKEVYLAATMSVSLSVDFLPYDTTSPKNVTWRSSNANIVRVDQNGVLYGAGIGDADVTATCNGFQSSARVHIIPYVPATGITLSRNSYTFSGSSDTLQLTASVSPADASNQAVSYKSSNPGVASVSGSGLVRPLNAGTAVITATVGPVSATCTVTVPFRNKVVVLDPGHSGVLTGASYYGYMEDQINLKVAQYCKAYLENNYAGVTVYQTRYDASPINGGNLAADLEGRAIIAQNHGADILVSLHFNATAAHNASGCLAFVSAQPSVASASQALANQILARLSSLGLRNHGPIAQNSTSYFDPYGNPLDYYAINRHCANRGIVGIIVEHCFMDTDLGFYNSEAALQRLAVCDAEGIAAYLGLQHK